MAGLEERELEYPSPREEVGRVKGTEVVAALSEGGDPDRVQLCLKSTLGQDLLSEAIAQFLAALQPYTGLFHLPGEALGHMARGELCIDVEGAALIHQRLRRVPIHRREHGDPEGCLPPTRMDDVLKILQGIIFLHAGSGEWILPGGGG